MLVRLGLKVALTGWALLTLGVAVGGAACSKNFVEPDSLEEVPPSQVRAVTQPQPGGGAGRVEYQAPTGWVEQTPSSRMRQAQYLLPRAEGDREDAELVVFHFPGQGGSIQANMARWIGQMSRPDGSSAAADAEISEKMVRGQKVTLLEVSGTYQSGGMGPMSRGVSKPGYRMLGAIIETTQGPWFFKLTGPVQTVEKWSDSWTEFVDSLRIAG